jgi:hypothetical protein
VSVEVLGWNNRGARADVDTVRVVIRRTHGHYEWLCREHGRDTYPHCHHLRALAQEPADPQKRN